MTDSGEGLPSQGSLSNKEFYETRGWANQGNVIEYGLSFNDGTYRGNGWVAWSTKFRIFNRCLNNIARNITFIETVSNQIPSQTEVKQNFLIQSYPTFSQGDGMSTPVFSIENCLFYYRFAEQVGVGVGSNLETLSIKNSGVYSEAKGDNGVTLLANSAGVMENIIYTDPDFECLPTSAPAGIDSAKLIKFVKDSVYYNAGSRNSVADVLGEFGNAIGWRQQF